MAIQTAEFGPMAQVAAGFDIAFHDLAARQAGLPLHRFLGGQGDGSMPAYSSGINPGGAADTVLFSREAGYRAFKLKVGFGVEQDLANLDRIDQGLEPGERLMVDANQAWDLGRAKAMSIRLGRYALDWLEEPILAAAGGDGLLEVDVNSNPLRENLAQPIPAIKAGQLILSDAPGLGVEPDLVSVGRYIVSRKEIR